MLTNTSLLYADIYEVNTVTINVPMEFLVLILGAISEPILFKINGLSLYCCFISVTDCSKPSH